MQDEIDKIFSVLDGAAGYALKYGTCAVQKPYVYDGVAYGGSRDSLKSGSTEYFLAHCGFEITVKDVQKSRTYGLYKIRSSDETMRFIRITLNGQCVIEAERCLGGTRSYSNMLSSLSESESINPTRWALRKSGSLDGLEAAFSMLREHYK